MIANSSFVNRPKEFWAHVRLLSQEIGYVERVRRQKGVRGQTGPIKVPTLTEQTAALQFAWIIRQIILSIRVPRQPRWAKIFWSILPIVRGNPK